MWIKSVIFLRFRTWANEYISSAWYNFGYYNSYVTYAIVFVGSSNYLWYGYRLSTICFIGNKDHTDEHFKYFRIGRSHNYKTNNFHNHIIETHLVRSSKKHGPTHVLGIYINTWFSVLFIGSSVVNLLLHKSSNRCLRAYMQSYIFKGLAT
jgi:hypothetical protein